MHVLQSGKCRYSSTCRLQCTQHRPKANFKFAKFAKQHVACAFPIKLVAQQLLRSCWQNGG